MRIFTTPASRPHLAEGLGTRVRRGSAMSSSNTLAPALRTHAADARARLRKRKSVLAHARLRLLWNCRARVCRTTTLQVRKLELAGNKILDDGLVRLAEGLKVYFERGQGPIEQLYLDCKQRPATALARLHALYASVDASDAVRTGTGQLAAFGAPRAQHSSRCCWCPAQATCSARPPPRSWRLRCKATRR